MERIDLVNVRYTEKAEQREFTALISASAKDYYTDDRTGKFIRGDRSPARFQEFWTFQRFQDRWVVRDIEQPGESDTLKEENFVEMLTDENIHNLYGETAKEGTDAAWLSKEEAKKATRIERLLNFLAQTDKLWNRRLMLERARQIFMSVYLAREAGDPQQIPAGDIFPDVAQSLKEQMQQWETEGLWIEYRNLCVRKAELIHVRNYDDRSRDEYTVRIDAHAQQVVRKGDQTEREQPYVTPFEEFLILVQQILIGMALGFALKIVIMAMEFAGHIMGLQMGLSFASLFDPINGAQTVVLSQLLVITAALILFAFNGHHLGIAALWQSFHDIPIGGLSISGQGLMVLVAWGGSIFMTGLHIALPVTAALLASNLAIGMMTRASPQLNIFAVGFPITIAAGFVVLYFSLLYMPAILEGQWLRSLDVGKGAMQGVVGP